MQFSMSQNTILWRVTDTVNHKTSTIVGTFHQFGNTFVDSIPEIRELLYKSDLAIFESVSKTEHTQALINKRKASNKVERKLKKKDFAKLQVLSKNWKVDIYKLRPIELKWKLQQEFQRIKCNTNNSLDTWTHFDNYLEHLARENNIKVLGLETDSLQLELINIQYNSPKWKDERKDISSLINMLLSNDDYSEYCKMANEYRNFGLAYDFEEPCDNDVLIQGRNEKWLQVLPNLFRTNNCFLAVGLFHLKNTCGLLEQLKSKGFLVEPIIVRR